MGDGHGRGPVPVQYHQFQISDEDGPAGPNLPREHNGLIEVQDGIATVRPRAQSAKPPFDPAAGSGVARQR